MPTTLLLRATQHCVVLSAAFCMLLGFVYHLKHLLRSSWRRGGFRQGEADLRLTVVSPFLDRQHGTELCVVEQIERFAQDACWTIEVYSQKVSQIHGIVQPTKHPTPGAIVWHRVSKFPGPHLLSYLWWLWANHWRRWSDRRHTRVPPGLIYTAGINCFDADVIVVHIVFHAFYERLRRDLAFARFKFRSWPFLIHRKLYYTLIKSLEQRIYRNPRVQLIAISGVVAAQLKEYFNRDNVTVIHNAVDGVRFNPQVAGESRARSRQSLSYSDSDFVVLLIGNDWKKKGLDALLKAIALLKDLPVRALIVGADDENLYSPLISELDLCDRLRFERPSTEVLSFYAAADLYTGPSLEDAFNLPVLEAMACGKPIIASSQAGASEVVQDGSTGFILRDPRDHIQLASLIRRICTDENLRTAVGTAASRYVLENCTWQKNTEQTKEFLERARSRRS